MYIIAGLGNPGKKYEHTRHNVGFDVMDVLAEKYNIRMDEKKYKAICGKGMIGSEKVVLVKPQTFMNLSGESIAEAVNFYKVDPASELLVIFDDISLAPGRTVSYTHLLALYCRIKVSYCELLRDMKCSFSIPEKVS